MNKNVTSTDTSVITQPPNILGSRTGAVFLSVTLSHTVFVLFQVQISLHCGIAHIGLNRTTKQTDSFNGD